MKANSSLAAPPEGNRFYLAYLLFARERRCLRGINPPSAGFAIARVTARIPV
jgi:hypothetical protein